MIICGWRPGQNRLSGSLGGHDPDTGDLIYIGAVGTGFSERDVLCDDGLTPFAKTSGSKGMQLYAAIDTDAPAAPSAYAKRLAQRLARETPDSVTAVMANKKRTNRVLIEWSQNNPAKTTVAPYSLRGRDHPTVSTPLTWNEVEACRHASQLVVTPTMSSTASTTTATCCWTCSRNASPFRDLNRYVSLCRRRVR